MALAWADPISTVFRSVIPILYQDQLPAEFKMRAAALLGGFQEGDGPCHKILAIDPEVRGRLLRWVRNRDQTHRAKPRRLHQGIHDVEEVREQTTIAPGRVSGIHGSVRRSRSRKFGGSKQNPPPPFSTVLHRVGAFNAGAALRLDPKAVEKDRQIKFYPIGEPMLNCFAHGVCLSVLIFKNRGKREGVADFNRCDGIGALAIIQWGMVYEAWFQP